MVTHSSQKNNIHSQLMELYKNCDNTSKTFLLEHYNVYSLKDVCFSIAYILVSISPIHQAQALTKAVPITTREASSE
jgi:hypothetical protein